MLASEAAVGTRIIISKFYHQYKLLQLYYYYISIESYAKLQIVTKVVKEKKKHIFFRAVRNITIINNTIIVCNEMSERVINTLLCKYSCCKCVINSNCS